MKKAILFLFLISCIVITPFVLKAQCYGTVHFDNAVGANGTNTFNITTSYCKELIMISYDGWSSPGNGPVKVDGNPATHIVTGFDNNNSGIAETYAYIATTAGTHTIVCTESPYSSPYWLNFAACFYVTGTGNPLTIASLTNTVATITCTTGGTITGNITTSIPNSMIYCNWENNNGQNGPFIDTWTGASALGQLHEGNGIDASHAYEAAAAPGVYNFKVSNNASPNNGCGGLVLVLVDIPPPVCGGGGNLTVLTSQTLPTCGLCNGSINVNVNGGTSPFTYDWSPNVSSSASANNLCAGIYTITVTDAACHDTTVFDTLPQTIPPVTPRDTLTINEKCNGDCNASSIIACKGGVRPYTYLWAPNGGTDSTASNLCVGVYTISVTDAAGCSGTTTATITQPAVLKVSSSVSNVLCNAGTGSATITPSGGTSPYTYLWTPTNQTTATATGLTAGTYSILITDVRGCTTTTSVSLTQPTQLTAIIASTTYPLCNGGTGEAASSGLGGVSPYTYSWSPIGGNNSIGTGLTAGTYTVAVKDNNGCTATASVLITQPTAVAGKITAIKYPVCNGNTGSATVKASGGVPGYKYLWTPTAQTTAAATGLLAGGYTLTITDTSGCTATVIANITQPAVVIAQILTLTNPPCNGGTGNATVGASGGVSHYTYKWNPGNQTLATATGLTVGIYTATVTDSSGCSGTITATLTQPAVLTATISATNYPICYGGAGNATVTAAGGTIPYTYLWSPGTQTTAAATGLSAGNYTIKVTDVQGCTATNTVTITQPVIFAVVMGTPSHIPCYGGISSVTAASSGGTSPYTYLWTPTSQATALATGLTAGTYSVSITDVHGCSTSASVLITQPSLLTAAVTSTTPVSCTNGNNGTATAQGSGGVPPYAYLWSPGAATTATATGLFAVSYKVTVTDADGCTATATTTLTQPTPVTATISEPKIICKDSTGILVANASGGVPGYKYVWSSGATSQIATVTPTFTNDYSVTVTDANGCSTTANIVLQYGSSFAVDITGRHSVCLGDSTSICANAIGAIDGVKYMWEPANNTNQCITVTPALTSVYTVTVVDGCGSTSTANTTVYTEPIPTVNINAELSHGCVPFCVQFLNGSAVAKGNIEQYIWDFGNGDSSHTKQPTYCYKTSGNYDISLTVVSDSGCNASLKRTDMITVYTSPKAAFIYSPQMATILTPTIQFTDESTDSYGLAYRWWTFGDGSDSTSNLTNPTHTYHDTGSYCATLIEMNNRGCMDTVTNCLVVEPQYNLYIPSAFTPNQDGKNEVFQPIGQYVKNFEMYIFDRWGIELFHSTSISQGWNGTMHGAATICQEDVYIYKITVTDAQNTQHSYIGNVTLLK